MSPRADKPVALVSMPTLSGQYPCFQLGLLKPTLERAGFTVEPFSLYLYFGNHIGWHLHEALAEVTSGLVGEWIWAREAFGPFADEAAYEETYRTCLEAVCERAGCTWDDLREVRDRQTGEFLDFCLESVDWGRFGLVGFTVLFQQQLATLAFARRLKERFPDLPIILGGGTFEDDIALEILRHCPQVDLIHCGDADQTLPELVRRLYTGASLRGLPGVLWRDGEEITSAGRAPNHFDLDATPIPDFDEYFHARAESGYDDHPDAGEVLLPIETARGCWWGEKHHCTFCGLNRSGMEFRARNVASVLEMLEELSGRYGLFHFNAIDNIMDPRYARELFGELARRRCDFQLHYEVRPTLTRDQLARMRAGGLYSVQPGIESFSTRILGLMRKGATAVRNLEMLKWTTYFGIDNLYNILVRFAGETAEDYRAQCEVVARIPHFQPPYTITRARPDRGSPMFTHPEAHAIRGLVPEACYRFLYPKQFDLSRVAYYFDPVMEDALPDEAYEPLFDLVARWQQSWAGEARPFLSYRKALSSVTIEDGRGPEVETHRYVGREARLYEYCAEARSRASIHRDLGGPAPWLDHALEEMTHRGLMIFLDERYLSLALPENLYHGMEARGSRGNAPGTTVSPRR